MKLKIEDVALFGDKILVKPLKFETIKQKQLVPDRDAIKTIDPTSDETPMKEITQEIMMDIQRAKVVAVGNSISANVKVGDTIFYHIKTGVAFEMLKDVIILKSYDIIGLNITE